MVDRAETQRRKINGSIGQTVDTVNAVRSPKALAPRPNDAVAALPRRIDQLTRELAEARRQSGQLEAMLEKRTNRLHQLIGERDRLTSLLAARDAEMLRLTRELGALAERAAPAVPRSSALLAATNAMLDRFRRFRNAPTPPMPARAAPAATERPSRERPLLLPSVPKAVLGVLVFGLSEEEIEGVLAIVERHCAERDLAPLLLTDNDAFQLFRGRRVLFEFLPPRSEQERLAPDLDWQLFTLRRLALIRRKWQPVRVVAFGRRAGDIMRLWLGSPFEATPIPTPLKAQAEGAEMAWGPVRQAEALQL
jgi:hypothetical protein